MVFIRSSKFTTILQARIHPYFPYFHVDVSADCVLFKPAVGQILGKVLEVSYCMQLEPILLIS